MNSFETCPNCESRDIRKGKIPLYVGGYYIDQFDGYWCPVCRQQFIDPAVIDKAQTSVKLSGLFGIAARQTSLLRPELGFNSFQLTTTNIERGEAQDSITMSRDMLFMIPENEPDGAGGQTYSLSNALTK